MKRITFFILSIFCLTACNNDLDKIDQPEVAPQIELIMPDAEKVSVYSTATVSECNIETMWVIVFNGAGPSRRWAEKITVGSIAKNGQAAQLLPQLNHTPTFGDKVVCIANVNPTDTSSLNYNNINTIFTLNAPTKKYYSGGDALPMYGEMSWSSTDYTCKMTRAVAKVQVQMGTSVSDVTGNFKVENVTYKIYNSASSGIINPDGSGNPGFSAHSTDNFRLVQYEGTEKDTHAYIYESESSHLRGDNGAEIGTNFNANRQHIILTNATNSFYRLDFYNSYSTGNKFLDTKRNHHYLLTINKVSSAGYTTFEQARDNPGSNIEYTIRIDDDFRYITSNGQYAIVTDVDTAYIENTGSQSIATVKYMFPTGTLAAGTVNSVTVESGNLGTFAPSTIPPETTNPSNNVTINPTSLVSSGSVQGVLLFKLGNISHRLVVKRK